MPENLQKATIRRSMMILAGGLASFVVPTRWMIGPSMMMAAIGFAEVMQTLQDPGPPRKTE